MRLVLTDNISERNPPVFDLPNVACSAYFHGDYGSAHFYGITPGKLHDIIGCPAANAYSLLVEAAWAVMVNWNAADSFDSDSGPAAPNMERLLAALTALDAIKGPTPCADCDSDAESRHSAVMTTLAP